MQGESPRILLPPAYPRRHPHFRYLPSVNHRYQKPHVSLVDYVRTVLVIDGSAEPDPSSKALVTSGMSALFFKENKATLFGKTVPTEYWEPGSKIIISYFFSPFAAACLFNIDAKKLAVGPIEVATIESSSIDEVVRQLDQLLVNKLESNRRTCEIIRYATDQMMIDNSKDVLPNIQDKLGLNERTFQRIFKKFVGITPVQYRRICQFDTSFTQLRTNEFGTLTDIAYDNGFADQSHFIKTFKEFAKTTPKRYLKSGLDSE